MQLRSDNLKGTWTGSFHQYSEDMDETVPMIMNISDISSNEFSGTIIWPDCVTKVKGKCEGDKIWWTEIGFLKGDNSYLYGIFRVSEKSEQMLSGDWLDPKKQITPGKDGAFKGKVAGTFVLNRGSENFPFKEKLDSLVDQKAVREIFSKAETMQNQGKHLEAVSEYSNALNSGMSEARVYRGRGISYYLLNKYSEGEADFDQSLRMEKSEPHIASDHQWRGLCRLGLGKNKEALRDFEEALQKDPELASHSFLYHALGTAQYKLGNYQSAVEWFDKAIAVKRFAGRTYFRRGKSLAQIGRTDEAEKDLAKAQELGYDGSNE